MTKYCNECGGKVALCTNFISSDWQPDQEPFNNGEYKELEDLETGYPQIVHANICVDCKKIHDIEIPELFKPKETMLDRPRKNEDNSNTQYGKGHCPESCECDCCNMDYEKEINEERSKSE